MRVPLRGDTLTALIVMVVYITICRQTGYHYPFSPWMMMSGASRSASRVQVIGSSGVRLDLVSAPHMDCLVREQKVVDRIRARGMPHDIHVDANAPIQGVKHGVDPASSIRWLSLWWPGALDPTATPLPDDGHGRGGQGGGATRLALVLADFYIDPATSMPLETLHPLGTCVPVFREDTAAPDAPMGSRMAFAVAAWLSNLPWGAMQLLFMAWYVRAALKSAWALYTTRWLTKPNRNRNRKGNHHHNDNNNHDHHDDDSEQRCLERRLVAVCACFSPVENIITQGRRNLAAFAALFNTDVVSTPTHEHATHALALLCVVLVLLGVVRLWRRRCTRRQTAVGAAAILAGMYCMWLRNHMLSLLTGGGDFDNAEMYSLASMLVGMVLGYVAGARDLVQCGLACLGATYGQACMSKLKHASGWLGEADWLRVIVIWHRDHDGLFYRPIQHAVQDVLLFSPALAWFSHVAALLIQLTGFLFFHRRTRPYAAVAILLWHMVLDVLTDIAFMQSIFLLVHLAAHVPLKEKGPGAACGELDASTEEEEEEEESAASGPPSDHDAASRRRRRWRRQVLVFLLWTAAFALLLIASEQHSIPFLQRRPRMASVPPALRDALQKRDALRPDLYMRAVLDGYGYHASEMDVPKDAYFVSRQ